MLQLQARALNSARTVSTKYGPKLVLDCLATDGKEYTVWRPVDDETLPKIARNERISLGVDSKGKCHLLECLADHTDVMAPDAKTMLANQPALQPEKPVEGAYNGRSAEIADYIQRLGKLYKFSYQTAKESLAGEAVTSEDTCAVATAFFIQAVKHFDL
jgi:hypothetical protein